MQELQAARDAALAQGAQRAADLEAVREAAAAKEAELSGLVSQLQQDLASVQAEREAKETERLGLQAQAERLTKELVRLQAPRHNYLAACLRLHGLNLHLLLAMTHDPPPQTPLQADKAQRVQELETQLTSASSSVSAREAALKSNFDASQQQLQSLTRLLAEARGKEGKATASLVRRRLVFASFACSQPWALQHCYA